MFSRLKRSLVESYVGALALGWIFAYAILDFVSIFTAPLTYWVTRSEYRTMLIHSGDGLALGSSVPYVVASPALFLFGYLLLRWLYYGPPAESGQTLANPD